MRVSPVSSATPGQTWSRDIDFKETQIKIKCHFFPFFGQAELGVACEILVPPPGMEPTSLVLEAQSLNHWTAREIPRQNAIFKKFTLTAEMFKVSSKYTREE